jgi:hypothetical protein
MTLAKWLALLLTKMFTNMKIVKIIKGQDV